MSGAIMDKSGILPERPQVKPGRRAGISACRQPEKNQSK
jgi:hypothetical protein